ncbi:hypothetical protein [uncultured Victivallis sp.]|uniref:hypothetical protein n=1 Tax=uncultured Victivallis sp. TaxID=354118 RepID=UPI0025853B60|nr:hypothetical protein [uncultured Victivallis sp.]
MAQVLHVLSGLKANCLNAGVFSRISGGNDGVQAVSRVGGGEVLSGFSRECAMKCLWISGSFLDNNKRVTRCAM